MQPAHDHDEYIIISLTCENYICAEVMGSGEETEYMPYQWTMHLPIPELSDPQKGQWLAPSDWVPVDGIDCPQCENEIEEEALHQAILDAINHQLNQETDKNGWKATVMDANGQRQPYTPNLWGGSCAQVADAVTSLVPGSKNDGGMYSGAVHPLTTDSFVEQKEQRGEVMHSWVHTPGGRILDPTRWGFGERWTGDEEQQLQAAINGEGAQIWLGPGGHEDYRRSSQPHMIEHEIACSAQGLDLPEPHYHKPDFINRDDQDALAASIRVDGVYNEMAAARFYKTLQPSGGAVHIPLQQTPDLADLLHRHPDALVAISDVHSSLPLLQETLFNLGMIDEAGERTEKGRLLQIGDLIDGRDPQDYDTLQWAHSRIDVFLVGNHEAAMMGGGSFEGQQMTPPEIKEIFRNITNPYNMKLQAAHAEGGVLYTHAGVQPRKAEKASEAAARINDGWEHFLMRSHDQDPDVFAVSSVRGGTGGNGGSLWQDWSTLVKNPSAGFRQVVGHSPRGSVEASYRGESVCIDQGGGRLGISVQLRDGRMVCGSSDS